MPVTDGKAGSVDTVCLRVGEMTPITDPFLTRIGVATALTRDQAEVVRRLQGRLQVVPPRTTIVRENASVCKAYAIREGWAFAYKILPDGGRQVVDFLLPGDVVGFAGLFSNIAAQSCETITEAELVEVPYAAVRRAGGQSSELMEAFLALTSRERDKLVEHLLDLGRRDSLARVAHLLLELDYRLQSVGRGSPTGFACPISQYLLADALGLTAIHVNRVLRKLRVVGLLTFRFGHVTFHDLDRLIEMTGFDPAYVERSSPSLAPFALPPARSPAEAFEPFHARH
jgi:CRP-like cAMP-binding protein